MSPTITVSSETYRLLEFQARIEGHSIDQMAERLLQEPLQHATHNQIDTPPPGSPQDLQNLLRQALGLSEEEIIDLLANLPSAAEIREELSRYIPAGVKLSDDIIAMRDE